MQQIFRYSPACMISPFIREWPVRHIISKLFWLAGMRQCLLRAVILCCGLTWMAIRPLRCLAFHMALPGDLQRFCRCMAFRTALRFSAHSRGFFWIPEQLVWLKKMMSPGTNISRVKLFRMGSRYPGDTVFCWKMEVSAWRGQRRAESTLFILANEFNCRLQFCAAVYAVTLE